MPQKKRSLLDLFAGVFAASVLLTAAFFLIAPFRVVALSMAGRSTGCPLAKALKTRSMMDAHSTLMKRYSASSRLVSDDREAGLELWETPKGRFWLPKNQGELLASLLAEQDQHIYGSGEHTVRAGDVVLDAGAHIGVFTRVAIEAGAKLVVAIEPAPKNLECLRRNMAPEIAAGRVVIVPEGVWHEDGKLPFHMDPTNSAGNTLLHPETTRPITIEVPLTTIDKLAIRLNLPRVDFIKMDIEGAEQNALKGATKTISKDHPRMAICAYHTTTDAENIPKVVRTISASYKTACGLCEEQDFRIIPQTLFFY